MKQTHFFAGFVIVLGVMFELFPDPSIDSPRYDLWVFYEPITNGQYWGGLTWQQYAYYTMEHLALMTLAFLLYIIGKRDGVLWWFFLIQCGQLADFWLTYNTEWFKIGVLPVTMNIFQAVVFVVAAYVYGDTDRRSIV